MSENLGARLRNAKESLSAWYDRLNAQWADAEKTLSSLNLSKNVWSTFNSETDQTPDGRYSRDFEHCLIFMKFEGKWHICYAVGEPGDPDSFSPRPVLNCSLETRVMALEGLPKLLEKIVVETETEANELEVTLGAAAESLASFKTMK
jgi:hypothetical protein